MLGVLFEEGVGRHPSISTGAYFFLPMIFFPYLSTTMLINFSRSITTGFLRIRFLSSLSSYSCDDRDPLQWKLRGVGMFTSFHHYYSTLITTAVRRVLQLPSLPHVMGREGDKKFSVREDRCFGCGACIALCPVNVLTLEDRMIYVDEPKCTHCKLCIPSCPVFALELVSVD